jgi:hypothetical protein
VQNYIIKTDSKVIVAQIEKECIARDTTLEKYLALIRRMENYFRWFSVEHIDRNKNTEADELAKAVARKTALPPNVFFQTIEDSSVKTIEPGLRMVNIIQGEDWRAPIMTYLRHHYERDNNTKLLRMQQRPRAYQIVDNNLYKTSIIGPLLHCLRKAEGKELLAEIHSGVRGGHIGSRVLTAKVFRQGFYWPSVIDNASKIVATCGACQRFLPHSRAPSQPSQLITPSWPLQRRGIDIVGPPPTAQGNYKYAVVTIAYFTKWIEAKPLVNIASVSLKKFFWQNIIC